MVEITSAAIGGVAVALVGGVGWFLKRVISGEGARETASLYSAYASIAATMKKEGLAEDDVRAVAALFSEKKKLDRSRDVAPSTVNPEASAMEGVPSYWTQSAMNARAAAAARLASAQLDNALTELSTLLTEDEAGPLGSVQAAWENYRDAQADFEALQVAGGSMEPLIRHSEEEAVTLKRLAEVQAMVEQRKAMEGV